MSLVVNMYHIEPESILQKIIGIRMMLNKWISSPKRRLAQ